MFKLVNDKIIETDVKQFIIDNYEMFNNINGIIPRIYCVDGLNFSAQVGKYSYCEPREDITYNNLKAVEIGFPSEFDIFNNVCDTYSHDPDNDVLGYYPIENLQEIVDQCGGIDVYETMEQSRTAGVVTRYLAKYEIYFSRIMKLDEIKNM
jgi:hypothetical protein